MKIVVKTSSFIPIVLLLPNWKFVYKIILNALIKQNKIAPLEARQLQVFLKAFTKEARKHKGLRLIDIQSKSQEIVRITL